jgi:hypothetical protein
MPGLDWSLGTTALARQPDCGVGGATHQMMMVDQQAQALAREGIPHVELTRQNRVTSQHCWSSFWDCY